MGCNNSSPEKSATSSEKSQNKTAKENDKSQSSGDKMQLIYFDGRGRGEYVRYVMAMGGIDYEDVRIRPEQWQDMKAGNEGLSLIMGGGGVK